MCLKISDYLRMFHVERLSGVFHIRKYDLVHHSFLVGILFERFAKKEGIEISAQALSSVLHHDVFETVAFPRVRAPARPVLLLRSAYVAGQSR